MSNEIIPTVRGHGTWIFEIYNPSKLKGPYKGFLVITKDHYVVFEDSECKRTLVNIPAQNVSSVELNHDEF